jgi:hypothetical protein
VVSTWLYIGGAEVQDWIKALISATAAAVIGILTAALRRIWNRQKAQAARQVAVEEGVKALLHDRLCQACACVLDKGKATVSEIENIEFLYSPYVALGGNGTAKQLYERVAKIQIDTEELDEKLDRS